MKLQLKLKHRDCLIGCTLWCYFSSKFNRTTLPIGCFSANSSLLYTRLTGDPGTARYRPDSDVVTLHCCFYLATMTMSGDLNVNPTTYTNLTIYCQLYRLLVQLTATKTRLFLTLPTAGLLCEVLSIYYMGIVVCVRVLRLGEMWQNNVNIIFVWKYA